MIQGRAEVLGKTYDWYQQIDASYFALYQKVRDTLTEGFAPYTNLRRDFTAAYESVNLGSLNETTATNFNQNYEATRQALEWAQLYSTQYALSSFGSSMLSDLTYPASNFKSFASSPLMTLFSHLTMQMEPLSETCIASILSKVIPTLEPYAEFYIDISTQAVNDIPTAFSSASSSIKKTIDSVNALILTINNCAAAGAAANACVDQIVSKPNYSPKLLMMNFFISTE